MAEQFTLDISGKTPVITPRKQTSEPRKNQNFVAFYIGSAGSIGFAIIIPLLLGIGVGVWLDSHFMTKPQFTFGGLAVGLLLSIGNLIVTVRNILKKT